MSAELWDEYLEAHPEHRGRTTPVDRFGDSTELADELIDLVVSGRKRATAGLLAAYEHDGVPVPAEGDHWVAADGAGRPRVVLRIEEARVGRLDSVDEDFARDEGEGDLSVEYWLDAHRAFMSREVERLGLPTPDGVDALDVVFERFRVVWPEDLAD